MNKGMLLWQSERLYSLSHRSVAWEDASDGVVAQMAVGCSDPSIEAFLIFSLLHCLVGNTQLWPINKEYLRDWLDLTKGKLKRSIHVMFWEVRMRVTEVSVVKEFGGPATQAVEGDKTRSLSL